MGCKICRGGGQGLGNGGIGRNGISNMSMGAVDQREEERGGGALGNQCHSLPFVLGFLKSVRNAEKKKRYAKRLLGYRTSESCLYRIGGHRNFNQLYTLEKIGVLTRMSLYILQREAIQQQLCILQLEGYYGECLDWRSKEFRCINWRRIEFGHE